MKIKLLSIPVALSLIALSSCSGSALNNEKVATKQEFETAIATVKENTYNRCEIRGSSIINDGSAQKFDFTSLLSWDSIALTWNGPSVNYGITADKITVSYAYISEVITLAGVADQAHYWTADNGYHFKIDATKTTEGTTPTKKTVQLDYIWNEFGYPISEKATLITEYSGLTSKDISEYTYTYSKVN